MPSDNGPERVIEHGNVIFSPRVVTLALDLVVNPVALLARHLQGDWRNLPLNYAVANNFFLHSKERVQSRYEIDTSTRIYVVTDIDLKRTVLFVDDDDGGEFESMKDELTMTRTSSSAANPLDILAGRQPPK